LKSHHVPLPQPGPGFWTRNLEREAFTGGLSCILNLGKIPQEAYELEKGFALDKSWCSVSDVLKYAGCEGE
jgi:hypothetical protein